MFPQKEKGDDEEGKKCFRLILLRVIESLSRSSPINQQKNKYHFSNNPHSLINVIL